jgi:hypothetical protein
MRLNGFNISYNNWPTRPYSYASPDAGTKVTYSSDQLGDGDVCYVVARRPDPPRKVSLKSANGKVRLSWHPPEHSKETDGYVVYGAGKDNRFRPLHGELVKETGWTGDVRSGVTRFAVAAREWSGLESFLSEVVKLDNRRHAFGKRSQGV